MGERNVRNVEVRGSTPLSSIFQRNILFIIYGGLMKTLLIAFSLLAITVISGCSNPWNPYPYFNPIPTEDNEPVSESADAQQN